MCLYWSEAFTSALQAPFIATVFGQSHSELQKTVTKPRISLAYTTAWQMHYELEDVSNSPIYSFLDT